MSESRVLLLESAERAFAALSGVAAFDVAWPQLTQLGFGGLLLPESQGGFGGDWGDAFAVARLAGVHALAAPLGESVAAARLCADAGIEAGDGLLALGALADGGIDGKGRFSGRVEATPWGRKASRVVIDVDDGVACLNVAQATVRLGANPAGEPRDTFVFEGAAVQTGKSAIGALAAGALVRVAQIAGALDTALSLSIQYANERSQFGKQIGKFQAVQQALATFAEEAAAVNCAGEAAARAANRDDAGFEIGAAKLRANMAAAVGASVAHQVHGAIGFTHEHRLHIFTRRLIAWRSEFGGERYWAERIGAEVCARGADALWPFLTARGDVG